ncbi:nucleotide pyrophosphohydrolase [Bifidobacterium dolichotidis]|uniref:Nucleotide pyrophosphohydrolase n=1 Tax=Bifidobacterium dolichotidis TaxID=2306976 RepID=A0A430FPL3_9BIFI|nr:nucleotide pyrophosphohydrolase [Bifidobacterium dolichotidis]RSX54771.1 nucleotide pyrophosphohydrolase [Bifidobacterium dolichotidis]
MAAMDFNEAYAQVRKFRDDRNWKPFHNPKDLAISINLEAAELLELFQWTGEHTDNEAKRQEMLDELADVIIYCMQFADSIDADIPTIIANKLKKNAIKYPLKK